MTDTPLYSSYHLYSYLFLRFAYYVFWSYPLLSPNCSQILLHLPAHLISYSFSLLKNGSDLFWSTTLHGACFGECLPYLYNLHWRKLEFPLPLCSRTVELDHVEGENCHFRTEQGRHTYEYTVTVEQAHNLYKTQCGEAGGCHTQLFYNVGPGNGSQVLPRQALLWLTISPAHFNLTTIVKTSWGFSMFTLSIPTTRRKHRRKCLIGVGSVLHHLLKWHIGQVA